MLPLEHVLVLLSACNKVFFCLAFQNAFVALEKSQFVFYALAVCELVEAFNSFKVPEMHENVFVKIFIL